MLLTGDDTDLMTLTCTKQRDGARKFDPIPLARQVVDLGEIDDMGEKVTSCVIVAGSGKITATATNKKLVQALEALQVEGATTATQWSRTLETMYKIPSSTFYHTLLPELLRQELVIRDGERRKGARYEISEKGTSLLTAKVTANSNAAIDTAITAATAAPLNGSSAAVNGSSNEAETKEALSSDENTASDGVAGMQQQLADVVAMPPKKRNARLYGPPTRPCFVCGSENWSYSEGENKWICMTCTPADSL
jgi:hypothetical protein